MIQYRVRPISDRTAFSGPAKSGNRAPFSAEWRRTEHLLVTELTHLRAGNVVLEMDVQERDIRLDGRIRSDARPSSPAVRLAFETPNGPMVFATNRFGWDNSNPPRYYADGWQENVRAIALGLQALRMVDRYGITSRSEQYRGFLALPPGTGVAPTGMTTDLAYEVLARESELAPNYVVVNTDEALRRAQINAHPDRHNGNRSRWNAVDEAEQVLRRAGRLS